MHSFNGDCEFREEEIYKSSFLRTLHFAINEWKMPDPVACQLALLASPINPDLAAIAAAGRPECLPSLESDEEVDQAVSDGLSAVVDRFRYGTDDEVLLFASAPLHQSPKRWLEFDVVAGWTGPSVTDAAEHVYARLAPLFAPGEHEPLTLPPYLPPIAAEDHAQWLMERGCLPAALQAPPDAWARWQTGLFIRGVSFPIPIGLAAPIETVRRQNCLAFKSANRLVGRWVWWHCAWSPGFPDGAGSSIGSALFVTKELFEQWSSAMNGPPRRLIRLRRFWRSKAYGDYQKDAAVTVWLE